jgi:hypothetical protein
MRCILGAILIVLEFSDSLGRELGMGAGLAWAWDGAGLA